MCDGEREIHVHYGRLAYKAYPIERRITRVSPTRESVHFLHPLTRVSHLLMCISLTRYKANPIARGLTRDTPQPLQ